MKKEEWILYFIISYFKEHIKHIFLGGVFCLIFTSVFFLYDLPIEAVGYAAILCAFLGCFFIAYDILIQYKKHKSLLEIKNSIDVDLNQLPEAKTRIEEDYQILLKELFLKKQMMESTFSISRKDMMDYYTLWVHQIKTPITAMSLLLQSDDSKRSMSLRQELFRIEQYAEMVLQYIRIESMSSDLMLEKYDIKKMGKQAVKKYASVFIYKHIRLTLKPLNENVLTDEKWLCFVIEQLLSNALKYTNKGEICIYMKADAEKQLVIEDTGIGISQEDLPRVFEQGFTGYNGRMHKKASGLGLYLCRQILRKLSHKIFIESEPNCGTKVILDLSSKEVEIE